MLDAFGITHSQQRCYEALISRPNLTIEELAEAVDIGPDALREDVARLEELGLLSVQSGDRPRLRPAPPNVAFEALILGQRAQHEHLRAYAQQLTDRYRDAPVSGALSRYMEVVQGADAFTQRFEQLQRSAQREVAVLNKPPYVRPFDEQEVTERSVLAAGVSIRAIYERGALEELGGYEQVTRLLGEGEQARVLPSLPMKLAIADSALALTPLNPQDPLNQPSALVYPGALLDALRTLFDALWEQAVPLGAAIEDEGGLEELWPLDERHRRVLQLLQGGLTDQVIARQLDVTERTVNRRVRELMDLTRAETRFQLGWRTSRAGWLRDHIDL